MDRKRNSRTGVVMVVLVCALCSAAFGQPWDGNGVEGDPYQIWTAEDMKAIGGNSAYLGAHFELCADIDLSSYTGASFNIIGTYNNPFTGVFDGNGHTISNFTFSPDGIYGRRDFVGLFGCIEGEKAEIKDLGIIGADIDMGTDYGEVGALVGLVKVGSIRNCYAVGGSVSGERDVGGLVGKFRAGVIADCYSSNNVSGSFWYVGGLIGHSQYEGGGIVRDCCASGNVSGDKRVGGLVGRNDGTIYHCYASGAVRGDTDVGGLVGQAFDGSINKCYSTGSVTGRQGVGGLVGANYNLITDCYAAGEVSGESGVGGLAGGNAYLPELDFGGGPIRNCYSKGSVSASVEWGGGLVGYSYQGTIEHCYSAADVNGSSYVGGLVGFSDGDSFSRCFWDTNIQPDVNGIGNGSNPDVIGEPTVQMQNPNTFISGGWDFVGESVNGTEDIWYCDEPNYPELAWESWALLVEIDVDEFWMYQSIAGQSNSDLTASVWVSNDPMGNSSYSYAWEIILPGDVSLAPVTVGGGGAGDGYWTFAARGCDEPAGLSDSGQTFTVRVTVTGDDYGNTGQAEAEFGIALLGDVNNDGVVDVADRAIVNGFWRMGSAGPFSSRDCDLNCDGDVELIDRVIANAVWRGALGQDWVSNPCPLR